jgi:hypothetical protein
MSINVNVFLELVALVTFDRVRCRDGNLAVSMSYLSVFTPILAEWHIVSSYTRCFGFTCANQSRTSGEVFSHFYVVEETSNPDTLIIWHG